ncbi:MAG: CamS family sex pheromone protein [Erysipelotrichaceae bacterium]
MKKISIWLATLFLLVGCGAPANDGTIDQVIDPVIAGEYRFVLPYTNNDARQWHNQYKRSKMDVEAIGSGLLERSKQHFSPNTYLIKDGELIGYNQLLSLLGRSSADNPYGLNPEKGSSFPSGDGINIPDAVLVSDIYEIDFVKQNEAEFDLEGLSFAIVLNPTQSIDDGLFGQSVTVMDQTLLTYGEEVARKFEQYLRTLPEVGNLPIYMTLFKAGSSDATLPGSFMAEALFDSRSAKFTTIDERWVIFPSSEATRLDQVSAAQFQELKNSLHLFLPEDIGIIGQGKYQAGVLKQLNITINMQAKTYLEIQGVVQYIAQQVATYAPAEHTLQIEVKSSGETKAVMEKVGKEDLDITILN